MNRINDITLDEFIIPYEIHQDPYYLSNKDHIINYTNIIYENVNCDDKGLDSLFLENKRILNEYGFHIINWYEISKCKNISSNFIENAKNYLHWDSLTINLISQNRLSYDFIEKYHNFFE